MSNKELIERAAIALYEAERADSNVGQHWISWDALIEKDREHPERGEKWGAGKYRRIARAVLAAVSDTTPKPNETKSGSVLASDTTPSEPTAKVVSVSHEASPSCSQGVCPDGCSHLMWECKACSCEGGWGAPRERLEELAAQHVCVTVAPALSEGWSTEDRRNAEAEAKSRWPIHEAHTFDTERDQIIFQQGCINGFMLGAEWWKATQQAAPTPSEGEREAAEEAEERWWNGGNAERYEDQSPAKSWQNGFIDGAKWAESRLTTPAPARPAPGDREHLALMRVWRAIGCAGNPDDFKTSVRDTMWDQLVETLEQYAAQGTRLHRENEQLHAELSASPAPARDEWEYARRGRSGMVLMGDESLEEARRRAEAAGGSRYQTVVKRLAPGPWLPVTEEER